MKTVSIKTLTTEIRNDWTCWKWTTVSSVGGLRNYTLSVNLGQFDPKMC